MALIDLVGPTWALRDKPIQRPTLLGGAPPANSTNLYPPFSITLCVVSCSACSTFERRWARGARLRATRSA